MGKNGEIYYVACHIIFDTIIINMDSSTEWAEQNLVGSLHCAFQNLSKFGLKPCHSEMKSSAQSILSHLPLIPG